MTDLMPCECPNCGRLHDGADFNANPGPVQQELAARDARITELEQALNDSSWEWRRTVAAEAERDALKAALRDIESKVASPLAEDVKYVQASLYHEMRKIARAALVALSSPVTKEEGT